MSFIQCKSTKLKGKVCHDVPLLGQKRYYGAGKLAYKFVCDY